MALAVRFTVDPLRLSSRIDYWQLLSPELATTGVHASYGPLTEYSAMFLSFSDVDAQVCALSRPTEHESEKKSQF